VDPAAIDRSQLPGRDQGKKSGDQRGYNNCKSKYPSPLHGRISRKAASSNRSSSGDRYSYSGRPTRLDRMGVDMRGTECRDSSDISCAQSCPGTSTAAIAASDARSGSVLRQSPGPPSNSSRQRCWDWTGTPREDRREYLHARHRGDRIRFRWSPGHEGVVENEEANDAAREASSQEGRPTAPARERMREVAGVIRLINRDRSDNPTPFDTTRLPGQYTWKMDQTLPEKHTLQLYGSLTSDQSAILIQARTGHFRLSQYLS
jgi:hypothetical protein